MEPHAFGIDRLVATCGPAMVDFAPKLARRDARYGIRHRRKQRAAVGGQRAARSVVYCAVQLVSRAGGHMRVPASVALKESSGVIFVAMDGKENIYSTLGPRRVSLQE